ncbi:MAG: type II restriction enzyme [Nitrososphaeraceae archaeon]
MKVKKNKKIEKWELIIEQLKIDVSKPVNFVTANQVKSITQEEPRLMAKMDRYENLPQMFKENNLFLLPISRKEYAIIKGNGYHKLEPIDKKLEIHLTSKPFPESAIGIESESVFLDYANSCGLLEKLCQTNNLILTFRGRRTTPKFSFKVNSLSNTINIENAQIEIDCTFETLDQIIIFEAKIGNPDSFNIRQLYYPFRTFYGKKKPIRNFFFYLIPEEKIYLFWEYVFDPYDEFNSIKLVDSKKYKVKLSNNPISPKSYQKIQPIEKKQNIPQADDINKIIEFPLRVFEGYDTSVKMINAFGFVKRQSSYYRQAAELLGLVVLDNNKYKLTQKGEEFLKLPAERKANYVCKLLLEFPIINEIFLLISIDRTKIITRNDIIELLKKKSHITGSTLKRRTQTIVSWFKWIRNNVGLVEIDYYGNISIAKQLKFN